MTKAANEIADAAEAATIETRPPMARLMETLGIVKGAKLQRIDMLGGLSLTTVDVDGVTFAENGERVEVIVKCHEAGISSFHYIRWESVIRFVR